MMKKIHGYVLFILLISLVITSCDQLIDEKHIDITDTCTQAIDGIYRLRSFGNTPEHFVGLSGDVARNPSDFDPNDYFTVLDHLSLTPGIALDYVYLISSLGGDPMLYTRPIDQPPIQTLDEYYTIMDGINAGDRTSPYQNFGGVVKEVHADGTQESYMQLTAFIVLSSRFYKYWHSCYDDFTITCNLEDIQYIGAGLPQDVREQAMRLNFTPTITIGKDTVSVRFVGFSEWQGFIETIYIFTKDLPIQRIGTESKVILPYKVDVIY